MYLMRQRTGKKINYSPTKSTFNGDILKLMLEFLIATLQLSKIYMLQRNAIDEMKPDKYFC